MLPPFNRRAAVEQVCGLITACRLYPIWQASPTDGPYYKKTDREIAGLDPARWGLYSPERAYCVWMHELGHAHDNRTRGGDYQRNPIPWECFAWQWAIENALAWTDDMHKQLVTSLTGYLNWLPEWGVESNEKMVKSVITMSAERKGE